jgi:Secretion system C-terminal sorting domain
MKNVFLSALALLMSLTAFNQSLTSVNPNSGTQGSTGLSVQISGSGTSFGQGTNTYVYFTQGTGTYLTGYSTVVNNATSLTTLIDIPFSANTGLYDLTVIDNGTTYSLASIFTVLAGPVPQITYVDTNYTSQGTTLDVTISGQNTNFQGGSNTYVWFSQGSNTIQVNSVNVISATSLVANVTVDINQPFGFYDVEVYDNTDGYMDLPYGFFVSDSTVGIVSVSGDTSVYNYGDSVTIVITGQGTHFASSGDTNTVWLGQVHRSMVPNVFPVSVQVLSNTQIRATFLFGPSTPQGYFDVFVSNQRDGELSKVRAVNHLTNGISEIDASNIKVYPNPVSSVLYIENTSATGISSLSLTSLTGALVLSQTASGAARQQLDLRHIDAGIYILGVTDQRGATSYRKIMIE